MSGKYLIFRMSPDPTMGPEDPLIRDRVMKDQDVDFDDFDAGTATTERKKKGADKYYKDIILVLMADFSMGYNPSGLPDYVKGVYPELWDNMFPGSFQHLLVLLFGSLEDFSRCQVKMHRWLDKYGMTGVTKERNHLNMIDESLFGSEIEMLRNLLAPLRGDFTSYAVYWIHVRTSQAEKTCKFLDSSMRVLERFHEDLLASLVVPSEHDPVNSKMTIGTNRDAAMSLRLVRLDGSEYSMKWENYIKEDLDFTSFHQFYKADLCHSRRGKAKELGFLPPGNNKFPDHILEGIAETLPTWSSCKEYQRPILDLIFKTAIWLGLARGYAPLHLFCDMVRHFNFHNPKEVHISGRESFLNHLIRVRVGTSVVRMPPACADPVAPFPYKDREFADRNPAYFRDVARSEEGLADDLARKLTLIDRPRMPSNMPNARLNLPLGTVTDVRNRRITISGPKPRSWEINNTVTGTVAENLETAMADSFSHSIKEDKDNDVESVAVSSARASLIDLQSRFNDGDSVASSSSGSLLELPISANNANSVSSSSSDTSLVELPSQLNDADSVAGSSSSGSLLELQIRAKRASSGTGSSARSSLLGLAIRTENANSVTTSSSTSPIELPTRINDGSSMAASSASGSLLELPIRLKKADSATVSSARSSLLGFPTRTNNADSVAVSSTSASLPELPIYANNADSAAVSSSGSSIIELPTSANDADSVAVSLPSESPIRLPRRAMPMDIPRRRYKNDNDVFKVDMSGYCPW
ncbi:hypothetical protein PHISCL_03985 [Aspergillus sclerotialis]|uniref:Uncharacterized protein n=1 Tax=Aspergillus sclerotialis TaxID=2070753 RepID=A0A3A2ZM75_9EURO|nr:hypothetical protein PHISCL_03985 [Aspergillus sclerotialis]